MKWPELKEKMWVRDASYEGGKTLLHLAVCEGNLVAVEILIELGCNLDATTPISHKTPLIYAVEGCVRHPGDEVFHEILTLLVQKGCDLNVKDRPKRRTALDIAVAEHAEQAMVTLLRGGAELSENCQIREHAEVFQWKEVLSALSVPATNSSSSASSSSVMYSVKM
jgi:ankyrin repeat protein